MVSLLRQVLDAGYPFFGICFGNQLLGRALGFGTYKLKFGHRGINQPVKDLTTGKVEVTAHNHGFAVDAPIDETVDAPFENGRYGKVFSHVDLNDDVVEGLQCVDPGVLRAVPPRGRRRPARCGLPVRPLRPPHDGNFQGGNPDA
jgi:carbamoyl-phosphate synthase small subunit